MKVRATKVRALNEWADEGEHVAGTSPLLLFASILMIVTVGSRIVRSFRDHR